MSLKCILSIDAGGMRCLIGVAVLMELEKRLARAGRKEPLFKCFDMIAGAGMGALVVAGLAFPDPQDGTRAASDPEGILALMRSENRFIFSGEIPKQPGIGPYAPDALDAGLKHHLGEKTKMQDALTHVVIPAFDLQSRSPIVFSSFDRVTRQFYAWQAARAAAADPCYFPPAMVEHLARDRQRGTPLLPLIHGGTVGDDPALAAYVEAVRLGWTGDAHELLVLSLGSGMNARPAATVDMANLGAHGTPLVSPELKREELTSPVSYQLNALLNADSRAFNGRSTRVTPENRQKLSYFRINGYLEKGDSAADSVSEDNVARLRDDAARIIAENSALLDAFVERLTPRAPRTLAELGLTPEAALFGREGKTSVIRNLPVMDLDRTW